MPNRQILQVFFTKDGKVFSIRRKRCCKIKKPVLKYGVCLAGRATLGCRQAVRHQTLTLAFVGSNPAIPANDPLAQLAEQLPFKQWVWSSNLQRVTKIADTSMRYLLFFCGDSKDQIAICRWHIAATLFPCNAPMDVIRY